jgi:hypothetical protein
MTVTTRELGRFARAWLLLTALLFAMASAALQPSPVAALSCTGSHKITLDRGIVAPGSGTTATSFVFSVRYRDTANCAPRVVNLRVAGVGTFGMRASATTYKTGVVFSRTVQLPVGKWAYSFSAASGVNAGAIAAVQKTVKPATVAVSKPGPATPTPTAKPGSATPKPSPSRSGGSAGAPTPGGSGKPGTGPGSTGGDDDGFSFMIPGIFGGPVGGIVGPWIALTGAGIAIFFFMIRRRNETPMGLAASAMPGGMGTSPGRPAPSGEDAAIPRGLRPSLHAARQAGWGVPPPRASVRFMGPAAPGVDRREIGYRLVRVADGPDDLRSEEIGRFDRGDQIEILETKGPFVRVRGADGLEGWVQQAAIVSILD